jgi:hypothetical protein
VPPFRPSYRHVEHLRYPKQLTEILTLFKFEQF